MKRLFAILLLLSCITAHSQQPVSQKGWTTISANNNYINGLKAKQVYLTPQAGLMSNSDDTAAAVFYSVGNAAYMFYKGQNIQLSGGITLTPRQEVYTGSSNIISLPWLPISSSIMIYIRASYVPPTCYTLSGNQVTINTALLGYPLKPEDKITINYQSATTSAGQ